MRFDDTLATVLALPATSAAARAAKWRQLVDLLAQPRIVPPIDQLEEALAFLRRHREEIDPAVRRNIAEALAGRRVSPMLLVFFGEDHPSIANPIVSSVRLDTDEWLRLLPSMSMTARALLRHRRDLEPEVSHALAAFGPSDFVLTGATTAHAAPAAAELEADLLEREPPELEAGDPEPSITELVSRIEEFRRQGRPSSPPQLEPLDSFRWETGPDGVITWVGDAPRGPLIGQTIATAALNDLFGVDGQAAGAFEKRSPFRDARFTVSGSGPASGDWRIAGVPFFHPRQGTFLGYRGTARRPRLDETALASAPAPGLFGTNLPPEALRQLIHELRTPLNAIQGFAELIEGEFMGPASEAYRTRAREIIEQAARLLSAVDDLDTAARLETHRLVLEDSASDTAVLLSRLHEAYEQVARQREARLELRIEPDLPQARVEAQAVERMFARMFAATLGLARQRETIGAALDREQLGGREMLCFAIDRPKAIAGLPEAALLDPGYSPEGDWPEAPVLGLGFALRLVRNLAEAAGGKLVIGDKRFFLYLPSLERAERSSAG